MIRDVESYLKARTEALVKDVGVEAACAATGKSKATIGRYYSTHAEHASRFMPVDAVARLEATAHHPFLSDALRDLARGESLGVRVDRLVDAAGGAAAEEMRALRAAVDALERRLGGQAGPARVTTTEPTE